MGVMIKELSRIPGISGREEAVRAYISGCLDPDYYEVFTDKVGNLHVKNPGKKCGAKILLDAHMDELGLIITGHRPDGTLSFSRVGHYYEFLLAGKAVRIGENRLPGVICRDKTENGMYIRTGCTSKVESEQLFHMGDPCVLDSDYREFGNDQFQARNIDDRAGCSILLELLLKKLDIEYTAVFTVREEVGILGAKVAAYLEEPDFAICLEGGSSGDIPVLRPDERAIVVGDGPAISVRNRYSVFDAAFLRYVDQIAQKHKIPIQERRSNVGGCDGHAMQLTKKGAHVITMAVPCRYIHSFASVGSKTDYINTMRLAEALLTELFTQLGEQA